MRASNPPVERTRRAERRGADAPVRSHGCAPGADGGSPVPFLGVGVGLRPVHQEEILRRAEAGTLGIGWLELLTENYLVPGGRPRRVARQLRELLPVAFHGVSLSIGSTDPLDGAYLRELRALADELEPSWISDHLCWTSVDGVHLHDLLPLPRTRKVVRHVADRVDRVQQVLGRRIALENVSAYLEFADDEMPEWEFLVRVAEAADCLLVLDVNNVFVSAANQGFDPGRYLDAIPPSRIAEIHLAGPDRAGPLLIDTHDRPVRDEVWDLFARVIRRTGPRSTLVEWDDSIPPYDRLEAEALRAGEILDAAGSERAPGAGGGLARPPAGRPPWPQPAG